MKTLVLDTSVIINDPNCFNSFTDCKIIVLIDVINELDKLKTKPNEVGKNARVFIRMLDLLIYDKNLEFGIKLNSNIIFIDAKFYSSDSYVDNKIIEAAKEKSATEDITVISRDISLRIKARAIGLKAENYSKNVKTDDLYTGYRTIINENAGVDLKTNKFVEINKYKELEDMYPNECLHITNGDGKTIVLGRNINGLIHTIKNIKPWGLSPKSIEQAFAIDQLCDPNINLLSIQGVAGTGKSLLTIASGLQQIVIDKEYSKFLIYKPLEILGKDPGFLPGSLEEKSSYAQQSGLDSLEVLLSSVPKPKSKKTVNINNWKEQLSQYSDQIFFETISYLRGRNLMNSLVFLDEGQNVSPAVMKTICTRIASGSKLIVCGDISQGDVKELDATNNGLTVLIDAFKESPIAGHITLSQCERSPLADAAARLL